MHANDNAVLASLLSALVQTALVLGALAPLAQDPAYFAGRMLMQAFLVPWLLTWAWASRSDRRWPVWRYCVTTFAIALVLTLLAGLRAIGEATAA